MERVILIPIYEDNEAAARLIQELAHTMGPDLFIVAVDDGSIRQPVHPELIAAAGLRGVVLRLKRNVGHQRAIATGLSYVADTLPESITVIMDSDGEDVPETIHQLLVELDQGEHDAAVAIRTSRMETIKFKVFYQVYRFIFYILAGKEIGFGNFMALRPSAVRRLAAMQETRTHVAASLLASKLRVARCPVARGLRYKGGSKMNFSGLVLHGFRALMVFAENVLVRVGLVCMGIMVVAMVGIILASILKLFGLATPGWFSIALGVLILILIQTAALTLSFLMLAGIARNNGGATLEYSSLVDQVLETS